VDLTGGERLVYTRTPDATVELSRADPTRLFGAYRDERIIDLDPDLGGSTLHVASDTRDLRDAASEAVRMATATARVLSAALRRGRILQQARHSRDDLTRLHAHVIQAEKLASLGQLVAGVIHELNNPLTSIVAYSNYLRKKALRHGGDADDVERLSRINEAAERILKFSRDLVAYARPAEQSAAPVPLPTVIDKALVFCEHEFAESGIVVTRSFDDGVPAVLGIPGQLTQVFVNLFTNAAHAMARSGGELSIRLRYEPASHVVIVDVTDQGEGIAPSNMDRIFEPFFTTRSDGRGTGLGLVIVRDIVSAHGGSLTAHSAPGVGTTFTIVLPSAQ
jgi:signal transduction histidine kinase